MYGIRVPDDSTVTFYREIKLKMGFGVVHCCHYDKIYLQLIDDMTRSTIGEGRGCNNFAPVLGGDGTKIAPTGEKIDQPPGRMSSIRGKLADHLGDHVVLSPEGTVLAISTETEPLYPRPLQSLNNSYEQPQITTGHRD